MNLLCFCSVLCLLCLCAPLFICALWSPAGKGLTSWLSFVVSNCEFVTFPFVSWVRCGTSLYRFLIFAPLLTFPDKPVIAKDLIEADDIGGKAVADFIDALLVKKICLSQSHIMLQANKVLRLVRSSKKKLFNLQNVNSQMRA